MKRYILIKDYMIIAECLATSFKNATDLFYLITESDGEIYLTTEKSLFFNLLN